MQGNLKRGFTLTELLVVMAITVILAGMLLPVLAQAKSAAKREVDLSNLKQSTLGALLYSSDHDDTTPFCPWPDFYANAARFIPYTKSRSIFKNPVSPFGIGTYQQRQGNNPFGNFMEDPSSNCVGNIAKSALGRKEFFADVYPPLDYQWNDSLTERAGGATCIGPHWGDPLTIAAVDLGITQSSARIANIAKVAMWSDFPSIGTQWPGGCVDGNCEHGSDTEPAMANYWGKNFKGFFGTRSNVSYFDGHADSASVNQLHPCGKETCEDANGLRTDFRAAGFTWASESVQ